MAPIFKSTWKFIKDVKIELDWEHEQPIGSVSKKDQREIEKILQEEAANNAVNKILKNNIDG
jgi:hypothetical protein